MATKKPIGLNGEPKGSYARGVKDGRQARGLETVEYRPFAHWRWGEWFTYVFFTVIAGLVALIIVWLVGCFIRWEVGPIPPVGASTGYYTNGTGHSGEACILESDGALHCR